MSRLIFIQNMNAGTHQRPRRRGRLHCTLEEARMVLRCHISFMHPGMCTSIWKTQSRVLKWFRVTMTRTRIQRILEETTNHTCLRDSSADHLDAFNAFIMNKRVLMIDQTKQQSWTLVCNIESFPYMTLDGDSASEVLELAMERLLQYGIQVIVHDQSSALTITDFRACKELCRENNMLFQVHPFGLKLQLQRKVERTHTFGR